MGPVPATGVRLQPSLCLQTLSKPVRTLEDLKGLKIRGTGRLGDIVKALGANSYAA